MDAGKRWLIAINLLGGAAVLGSYYWGGQVRSDALQILWGGVPEILRTLYTLNMFLAAAGYFFFTGFILFRQKDAKAAAAGWGLFIGLYAAILIPSALWLPLTYLALDLASPVWLWLVRFDLGVAALASLGLLGVLLRSRPLKAGRNYFLAIAGMIFFCIQTVLLDALIWGALFKV